MMNILLILTLIGMALLGYRIMAHLDDFLSSGSLHPYWDAADEQQKQKKRAA